MDSSKQAKKPVGWLLGLGILLFPWLFGWLLFQSGRSTLARVLGLSWLCLFLFSVFKVATEDRTAISDQIEAVSVETTKPLEFTIIDRSMIGIDKSVRVIVFVDGVSSPDAAATIAKAIAVQESKGMDFVQVWLEAEPTQSERLAAVDYCATITEDCSEKFTIMVRKDLAQPFLSPYPFNSD